MEEGRWQDIHRNGIASWRRGPGEASMANTIKKVSHDQTMTLIWLVLNPRGYTAARGALTHSALVIWRMYLAVTLFMKPLTL